MVFNDTLVLGILNLVAGILIILVPSLLRILVGGYLLLSGAIILLVYLAS